LNAVAQNGSQSTGSNSPLVGEESAITLRFSAGATAADLLDVRQILAASPGGALVQLMFESANGEIVRMDAGENLRVQPTPELKQRLARWLAA
jgi:hypothetical protein